MSAGSLGKAIFEQCCEKASQLLILVSPGDQKHLSARVLRVGSSLDKDGLHGHRTIREMLYTVVLEGALEMAVHT